MTVPNAGSMEGYKFGRWGADVCALRTLAQRRAGGVEIIGGPESHGNGRFAWIMDPDGNKVELWEPEDLGRQKQGFLISSPNTSMERTRRPCATVDAAETGEIDVQHLIPF